MSDMFCFQCQQTAGNKCCVSVGVCGKQPDTAALQDELVYDSFAWPRRQLRPVNAHKSSTGC